MNMDRPSVATKIVAGGFAGASETLVTYPAEFIKTRRQLPQYTRAATSSLSILKLTYSTSGLSGFYSGCRALVVSNAFKSGIRFLAFETSKDYLDQHLNTSAAATEKRNPWVTGLAGLSAGVVESVLVVTPAEVLKTKIIQDAATGSGRLVKSGLVRTASLMIRNYGVLALWKGLGPVLCKQGTNSAVRFTSFGIMKEKVARSWPSLDGNMGVTLILGAISGVVTVYASMPFDNIKTRMQSIGSSYTGMLDCTIKTLRNDGIAAFWRGTTPRLVRLTLSSGITFMVYDQVVRAMKSLGGETRKNLHLS